MRYLRSGVVVILMQTLLGTGTWAGLTVPSRVPKQTESLALELTPANGAHAAPLLSGLSQEPIPEPAAPPSKEVQRAIRLLENRQIDAAENLIQQILTTPEVSCRDLSRLAFACREAGQLLLGMRLCQRGLQQDARSPRLLLETGRIWMAVGQYERARSLFEQAQRGRSRNKPLDDRITNEALVNVLFKLRRHEAVGPLLAEPENAIRKTVTRTAALACYYTERGDYREALQTLSRFPKDTLGTELIAVQIQLLIGNLVQVRTDLEALQQAYPEDPSLPLHAALAALLDNDLLAVEQHLNQLRTDRKIPAQLALLQLSLRIAQGNIPAARKTLATGPMPLYEWSALDAIDPHLQPRELAIPVAYAHFCLTQGFPKQARETIATASLAHPDNVLVQWLHAETQMALGNHRQAAEILQQAAANLPASQTLRFLWAQALEEAGDRQQAKDLYAEILDQRPDFKAAALAYGQIWEQEENYPACLPIYATTLNYVPKSLPLLQAYAWALLQSRDFSGFKPVFRRLKTHAHVRPATLAHLQGWLFYQRGDTAQGIQELQKALNQSPGDPEICYHLGMALLSSGHANRAHQLLTYAMYYDKTRAKHGPQTARTMHP